MLQEIARQAAALYRSINVRHFRDESEIATCVFDGTGTPCAYFLDEPRVSMTGPLLNETNSFGYS